MPAADGDSNHATTTWEAPTSGSVLVPLGLPTILRIPVPGTALPDLPRGLVLTLRPPHDWLGRSPTAIFISNPEDARRGVPGLRLDYSFNRSTGVVDYHWNVDGRARARHAFPNITNHMTVGPGGVALYWGAKAFKIAGSVLLVVGATLDGVSIVTGDRPWRRTAQVVAAWAAAGVLATRLGRYGAGIGTFVEPGAGTAIGGGIGAMIGGFVGYQSAEAAAGYLYDWADGTSFLPAPEVPVPAQ